MAGILCLSTEKKNSCEKHFHQLYFPLKCLKKHLSQSLTLNYKWFIKTDFFIIETFMTG